MPKDIPYALSQNLKDHLGKMEKSGVIEKIKERTDWVSNLVIVPKANQELRICLDPTDLNKAIKRPHFPLPVKDQILAKLDGARIFTTLDAKNWFWQVELDEKSQNLIAFNTPFGRYKWKRMPFGIKSASEEYQMRMQEALEGIENMAIVADDILIFGKGNTKEEAERNHDKTLHEVLKRCQETGLKLNKDKIQFKLDEIKYVGHLITSEGVKPDPSKIQAILQMKAPENVSELRKFLGLINYLSRFLTQLSEETEGLRVLLKRDSIWQWDTNHNKIFEHLKELVCKAPVLKYYNVEENVTLQCDASQKGLGAALLQSGQPVAYASRALTLTEQNYAQIEKEMLAIVFAANQFDVYIVGKTVDVHTKQQASRNNFKKNLLRCPKRLQRMRLELQRYDLNVSYKPGKELFIADTLSRNYTELQKEHVKVVSTKEIENGRMTEFISISPERMKEIAKYSEQDQVLKQVIQYTKEGWPNSKINLTDETKMYFDYRDELSTDRSLLFRGERLVIPKLLRADIKQRLHVSH